MWDWSSGCRQNGCFQHFFPEHPLPVPLADFVYPLQVLRFTCSQSPLNYLAFQSFDCERT